MIPAFLEKLFGRSWLTSIIGIAGGAATLLLPILQAGRMPTRNEWLIACIIAALGMASKTWNITGRNLVLIMVPFLACSLLLTPYSLLLGPRSARAAAGLDDPNPVYGATGQEYWSTVKTAYVSATNVGDNTVVSAVTGKRIIVWAFEISASVASNVYWKSGATQNSELVYLAQNGGWVRESVSTYRNVIPALVTASGAALVLNITAQPCGVWVKYTEE